jgi:hypothetical protein
MEESKEKFPSKKDLYYIVSFLIVALVFVIAGRLADNIQVVDYVGFAGTIVSILLAVIAIIYSFYQSSTYANANSKLDSSADKIRDATEKLSNVSEIKSMMTEFKSEVVSLKESMEDVKSKVGKVDSGLSAIKQSFDDGIMSSNKVQGEFTEGFTQEFFDNFVNSSSKITLAILFEAKSTYKKGVELHIDYLADKFIKYVHKNDNPNEFEGGLYESICVGMLVTFNQLNFIDIEDIALKKMTILKMNEMLLISIENLEAKLIRKNNKDFYEFLTL